MKVVTTYSSRALAIGAAIALGSISSANQEYEVVNIGNLSGADFGHASAINNSNVIVGWSSTGGVKDGFQWSEQYGMIDMNMWGFDSCVMNDINDNGRMVGSFTKDGVTKGYIHVMPFPGFNYIYYNEPVGNDTDSQTFGLNNFEHMVGNTGISPTDRRAAGWTINFGGFTVPGYGPQEASQLYCINDADTMGGYAKVNGTQRATLFFNDQTLLDLHGALPGANASTVSNLNDQGWATGIYHNANNVTWSFLYNPELGVQTFENLVGWDSMSFHEVSGNGVVVGTGFGGRNGDRATRWTQETGLLDLNSLISANTGWVLQDATDVNENGYIIGTGTYNGVQSNFLLRPVPEPAGILALGLGCLALLRRRKN
ncbi:MAG: PEP-CTERM sorting domain-containing protein [Armatimonadetes bacterium]|nr:PEP-CTERM sorting domain-containing protein [Armatimonadota bacterium]